MKGFTNNATISGNHLSIAAFESPFTNTGTLSAANDLSITVTVDLPQQGGSGFTNTGTISGNNLSITDNSSPFTNSGTIAADGSGGSNINLTNNFTAGSFDNEHTITATNGATLSLSVGGTSSSINNGTISVGSGSRLILNGSLGGTGSMVIQDGGTLEVQSGTLADTVNFAGVGTLQLEGPNLVTGALSGLATGDVIALPHAIATSAVVNGTTLTITFPDGSTENLTLAAALPAGSYLSSPQLDGAGGTELVVLPTTPPTPAAPADSAVVNGYVNAAHDTAAQALTGTAQLGSTVTIYDNGTQVSTTTANATTGAWSFTLGQLADASSHSYTVTATDAAGNVSQPSGALSFAVDTTAPATPAAPTDSAVVNGYVNAAHDTAAQALTGTAQLGSTVTIYDNGTQVSTTTANATTGAWSFTLGQLADASSHSYTVTATDAAGNVSQPSGALSFAVDTTAPATPAAPTDSAVVNGYVNAAHDTAAQALTGTAQLGSTVTIYDNGTQVSTTTANATTGAWSFTLGQLADASSHSYTVTATDAAGNVSQPSGTLSFAVDTDAGEQAALSVTVNGGTPINAATDSSVPFTATGFQSDDSGKVTFSDGNPLHNQVVAITNGVLASSTVNLSGMSSGQSRPPWLSIRIQPETCLCPSAHKCSSIAFRQSLAM